MSSEVSVSTLTRMLKPRPKNALVSPLVQYGSLSAPSDETEDLKPVRFMGFHSFDEGVGAAALGGMGCGPVTRAVARKGGQTRWACGFQPASAGTASASSSTAESATHPKMPPWADTMSRPTR